LQPAYIAPPGQVIAAVVVLPDGDLVAAFQGGTVERLHLNPLTGTYGFEGTLTPLDGLPPDPSALAVLETASGPEVLVTSAGEDQLFIFEVPGLVEVTPEFEGPPVIPLPELLPPAGPVAESTVPSEAPLVLVFTLQASGLTEEGSNPVAGGDEMPASGTTDRNPAESPTAAVQESGDEAVASGSTDRNPSDLPAAAVEAGGGDEGAPGGAMAWADGEVGPTLDDALRELQFYRPTDEQDPANPLSRKDPPHGQDHGERVLAALLGEMGDEHLLPAEQGSEPPQPAGPDMNPPPVVARADGATGDLVWVEGLPWQRAVACPGPVTAQTTPSAADPQAVLTPPEAVAAAPGQDPGDILLLDQRWDAYRACLTALAVGGLAGWARERRARPAPGRGPCLPDPRRD
jgi:hypothetical protein